MAMLLLAPHPYSATSLLACAARRDVVAAVSAAAAPASAGPVAVADSASTLVARAAAGAGAAAVGCGHVLCAACLGSTRQQGLTRAGSTPRPSREAQYSILLWLRPGARRPARRVVGAPASRSPCATHRGGASQLCTYFGFAAARRQLVIYAPRPTLIRFVYLGHQLHLPSPIYNGAVAISFTVRPGATART